MVVEGFDVYWSRVTLWMSIGLANVEGSGSDKVARKAHLSQLGGSYSQWIGEER